VSILRRGTQHTGDPNVEFVNATALQPPEVVVDHKRLAEYESQLEAANKVALPEDDDL